MVPAPNSETPVDVIGVGAGCIDLIHLVPTLPQPGAKVRVTEWMERSGGQTATAMTACARLGLRVRWVGVVGEDAGGRQLLGDVRRHGVETDVVMLPGVATATATILVDARTGDRTIAWRRDERLKLPLERLGRSPRASVLHVDDVDEEVARAAATIGHRAGLTVTTDIDHVTSATRSLLDVVTVPILAEEVPRQLTGLSDPAEALRVLWQPHHAWLCVTLGAEGAMGLHRGRIYAHPGYRVEAVDTTGAGDVFRAGWIYGRLQGWPPEEVLRFANAAAALSCTRHGAISSVPRLSDVLELVARAGEPAFPVRAST